MNNKKIHFNIVEQDEELLKIIPEMSKYTIVVAYEEDANKNLLTASFKEEDYSRLEELSEFGIYESMESVYDAPDNKSFDELKEYMISKGFIYNSEFQKA